MPSDALAERIQGMREAKAAFQALPAVTRDRMNAATDTTIREIARGAQGRLLSSPSIQTRALYNHVAFSMNVKNGRGKVGISAGTTRITVGGKSVRVRGIVTSGRGGSASTKSGARTDNPAKRAHFVEFGTVHMKAEPFMLPSAEAEKHQYLDRCVRAGKQIESDLAHIGSRTL